jgi:hypothetical protein
MQAEVNRVNGDGGKVTDNPKRELYLLSRNSTDASVKNHYKKYCRILKNVIKEAKKAIL